MIKWIRIALSCLLVLLFAGIMSYSFFVYKADNPFVKGAKKKNPLHIQITPQQTPTPKLQAKKLVNRLFILDGDSPTPTLALSVGYAGSSAMTNNQKNDDKRDDNENKQPAVTPTSADSDEELPTDVPTVSPTEGPHATEAERNPTPTESPFMPTPTIEINPTQVPAEPTPLLEAVGAAVGGTLCSIGTCL